MKHLTVGLCALSIFALSVHYKIVRIDVKPLHKNAWDIVVWIASLTLGAIISSWLN